MIYQSHHLLKHLGITLPIIQAPMAGVDTPELAIAVTKAGGLGSLACAMLSPDDIRNAWRTIRASTTGPVNLNFFCHHQKEMSPEQQEKWKKRLTPYYQEFGLDSDAVSPSPSRVPFSSDFCDVIEELKPSVVSFHFGLPSPDLLARVKATGAIVLSSATTVKEALWLEENGCDMIIAQGIEAGGHRAIFLEENAEQLETFPLLEKILDQLKIPVIAAGGIATSEDIKRALSLGAIAVQLGTPYLFCPEARISPLYRKALSEKRDTTLTNVFSGRPARGIVNRFINEVGPLASDAPDFPYASHFVSRLRQASEKMGSIDFMQLWSGKNPKPHTMDAGTLTKNYFMQNA